MTYRIEAPHFVAGIVVHEGKIIQSAPIISYSIKMGLDKFLKYCDSKKWKVEKLE